MSPSMSDALNGLLQEQYKQCWSYLPLTGGQKYVAKIRISYPARRFAGRRAGAAQSALRPAARGLADSALRAVRRCNPHARFPPSFQPYFEQWKDWVVGFDPEILN